MKQIRNTVVNCHLVTSTVLLLNAELPIPISRVVMPPDPQPRTKNLCMYIVYVLD
jgi:hypothetical protein